MNSWDLGNTVSCSAYLLIMGSWGFRILKCVLVGSWGRYVGCGTLRTLDPEIYTCMGPWEPRILECIPDVGPWEPWILKCILDAGP